MKLLHLLVEFETKFFYFYFSGSGSRRGRNFSGDSSDIYPFNMDGPPAYGENIPEPAFVTPILQSGMAYFYGDGQFNPTAATVAATGLAGARLASEEVLKSNIKAQMWVFWFDFINQPYLKLNYCS